MADYKKFLKLYKNERGFTLIELVVASTISIILLAVLAGVVTSQGDSFSQQNQLNQMQTNGRAATEFISRAVQNAGYNVFRGTRFLAGSDHYISAVYDQNNDGAIQNNEVMTFAAGNNFTGSGTPFDIKPYFDRDGNGEVDGTETAVFPITMTLTAPPYNIYKVLPDNTGTGVTRHLMARNIDNLVIRYYDKDDNPLPSNATVVNGLAAPPYDFSADPTELNDIRKVDIEVLARTNKENPRAHALYSGTYVPGSVATVGGGSSYSDAYQRQAFNANQAPRNLVMAPWGKMDVVASPLTVNCPVSESTVTATLVDSVGDPVASGVSINFAASDGGVMSPSSSFTNAFGEAISTVSYNWTAPNASVTVSANSLITASGKQYPVFSASTANFQSGTGTFADTFTDGLDPDWEELDNPAAIIEYDADGAPGFDALRMSPTGFFARAVNGCNWQQYQVEFELTAETLFITPGNFVGGYLRYVDANNNYSFLVYKHNTVVDPVAVTGGCVGDDLKDYCLRIVRWNGGETDLGSIGIDFVAGVKYKMLAQAEDEDLRAKIWNANLPTAAIPGLDVADPNPNIWVYDGVNFPEVYPITANDDDYDSGRIGLIGSFNGVNVDFDNFSVSPIN